MRIKLGAMLVAGVMSTFVFGATQASATVAYAVDTLLGSADLGSSGDAVELAGMCAAAGFAAPPACPLTMDLKLANSDVGFNVSANDANSWFIDVAPTTPGYFLLKFGTGNSGLDSHYFFQNIADFTKLVFTNAQVNFLSGDCTSGSCNIGKLSHYATFDGSVVPIPAALPLLLTGLGGLGWLARRRAKKA